MKAEKTFSLLRAIVGTLDVTLLFIVTFLPIRSSGSSSATTYLPVLLGAGVAAPLFFGLLFEILLFAAPILLVLSRNKIVRFLDYALALADFGIVFVVFASSYTAVPTILLLVYGVLLVLMTAIDFVKEVFGERIAASFQKEDKSEVK
jgi:hypothetical protein